MEDLNNLLSRIEALEAGLEAERSLNAEQQRNLARHVQRNRRNTETLAVAMLGFLGFLLVVLTGLRLEFDGGSFQLPSNLLESSALVGGAVAIAKHFLDKQIHHDES